MTNKLPEIGDFFRLKPPCEESEENYRIEVVYISGDLIYYKVPSSKYLDYIRLERFWDDFEPLPKEQEEVAISKKETTIEFDVAKMCVAKEELKGKLTELKEVMKYHVIGDSHYELNDLVRESLDLINALDDMGKKDDNLPMKEEDDGKCWSDPVEEDLLECDNCLKKGEDVSYSENNGMEGNFCNFGCEPIKKTEESLPKSIWKDVSELPEENHENWHYLVRWNNGEVELNGFDVNDRCFNYLDGTILCNSEIVEFCTLTDFITEHKQTKELAEQNTKDIAEMKLKMEGR